MSCVLVHKPSNKEVSIGDELLDFRGDKVVVLDFHPTHPGSSGRVKLRDEDGYVGEYYPGVIDCEIRQATERGQNPFDAAPVLDPRANPFRVYKRRAGATKSD